MSSKKIILQLLIMFFLATCFIIQPAFAQEALPQSETKNQTAIIQHPDIGSMLLVKGGCFQMGDMSGDGQDAEKPAHEVCVDDFYLDKFEVTQREYQQEIRENPSYFQNCDDCPVEQVTWSDAYTYCIRKGKRLPTEAEWEYAARSGGKEEKYAGTNDNVADYAWSFENSAAKTNPVGQKKPNGLGFYDMSGNVWEWCNDWYDDYYYTKSPRNNPPGPVGGIFKVLRGGSWYFLENGARTTLRFQSYRDYRYNTNGFRCAKKK